MNKIIAALVLLLAATSALADGACTTCGTTTNTATPTSSAGSSAGSTSIGGDNILNLQAAPAVTTSTSHSYDQVSGTETLKNVPNPSAPALTTSNDTCMGSTSGSITIAGLGIGGGSTWVDTNCKRLKNSRELWNMGMKGAAIALMCKDDENRDALERTGFECPEPKKKQK